jgi:hypothetical protein
VGPITPLACCRVHDEHVNFGEIVLSVIVVWSLLSIIVSLAVGGMARARDTGTSALDHNLMTGRLGPGTVTPQSGEDGKRAIL